MKVFFVVFMTFSERFQDIFLTFFDIWAAVLPVTGPSAARSQPTSWHWATSQGGWPARWTPSPELASQPSFGQGDAPSKTRTTFS